MNENLNEAVAALINKALSGVETSVSFLQAETPLLIQELLIWTLVSSSVGLVIATIFLYLAFKGWLLARKSWDARDDNMPGWVIGTMTFGIVGVMMFIINTLIILKVLVAPKIWLLEYAASLVK